MGADFIVDIFELIPLKASIVIMFLTWLISRQVKRDVQGRLPNWFPFIPLGFGLVAGIPGYLLGNIEAVATQATWITVLHSVEQGLVYGAVAIGLWSARSAIPYFNKVVGEEK